jgi:hypothetical protein
LSFEDVHRLFAIRCDLDLVPGVLEVQADHLRDAGFILPQECS